MAASPAASSATGSDWTRLSSVSTHTTVSPMAGSNPAASRSASVSTHTASRPASRAASTASVRSSTATDASWEPASDDGGRGSGVRPESRPWVLHMQRKKQQRDMLHSAALGGGVDFLQRLGLPPITAHNLTAFVASKRLTDGTCETLERVFDAVRAALSRIDGAKVRVSGSTARDVALRYGKVDLDVAVYVPSATQYQSLEQLLGPALADFNVTLKATRGQGKTHTYTDKRHPGTKQHRVRVFHEIAHREAPQHSVDVSLMSHREDFDREAQFHEQLCTAYEQVPVARDVAMVLKAWAGSFSSFAKVTYHGYKAKMPGLALEHIAVTAARRAGATATSSELTPEMFREALQLVENPSRDRAMYRELQQDYLDFPIDGLPWRGLNFGARATLHAMDAATQ